MPTKELQTLFISINGEELKPLTDFNEQIETSELEEGTPHNFGENDGFEISFSMDKEVSQKLHAALQPKHGEKLMVETSCVCDGTLEFAVLLMQSLMKIGAVNIKIQCEDVENPNPLWMSTRFIAIGIVWNTNNFRRRHGIPMKRRMKVKKRGEVMRKF